MDQSACFATTRGRSSPPLAPKVRQVRRAPLRRTDFEQFGYTDSCPSCANARAGRKQAVDHSEQCRSRMETMLSTTTEGHERLERARDRFAQAAKEPGGEKHQRNRHRPEGEGVQPLALPASSNYREGGSSSSGSTLSPPPAPPPHDPSEVKTAREKEIKYMWDVGRTSTPPKRRHGREQDATQLASSESIPTKEAPKPHVTVRVWCVRRCAIKGSNRSSRQHLRWKLCESYSVSRVRKTFCELRTLS